MQQDPQRWRVNAPQVIFEVFEDEIIIVCFLDGSYYSVRGSAAAIWQALHAGAPAQHIIAAFVAAHPRDEARIAAGVTAFIGSLARAQLVMPACDSAGDAVHVAVPAGEFQAPALESYTDMQDLLLLDPIHDVDDMGWPKQPAGAGNGRT